MEPKTLRVNDVEYVQKDSVSPGEIEEKRIIVADRGWVFVGDCTDNEDGSVTIQNCQNLRRWGTSKGLGQLINGPLSETKTDDYGTVKTVAIVTINVESGW